MALEREGGEVSVPRVVDQEPAGFNGGVAIDLISRGLSKIGEGASRVTGDLCRNWKVAPLVYQIVPGHTAGGIANPGMEQPPARPIEREIGCLYCFVNLHRQSEHCSIGGVENRLRLRS